MRAIPALARVWPLPVEAAPEVERSIRFLGWTVEPADVAGAGYGAGMLAAVAGGLVALATGLVVPGVPAALAIGVLVTQAVHAVPGVLARAARTSALSAAPELLALAALRMRLGPAPERAAAFAAEHGRGPLAASLSRHVRAARNTPRTGLEHFGAAWAEWFPALPQAVNLLEAAGSATPNDRGRLLDRALSTTLEATRSRLQSSAASIRGPATVLYAFGVLLPTALVSLVPAATAAGLPVTLPIVVVVYDIVLPAALLVSGVWLLARRPVAFPPPALDATHPDVTDRRASAVVAGLVAGALGAIAVAQWLPSWAPALTAVGVGAGVALVVRYRPYVPVRRRIRQAEAGLAHALSVIGRRVAAGRAVERAVADAADDLDGEIRSLLAAGAARQRRLAVDLDRAFLGRNGVLATVPSARLRAGAALLGLAAREGRPAGDALSSFAGHLDDLERVERDARADLKRVVGTLRSTGRLFGPLVGGATVALAAYMRRGDVLAGGGHVPSLGLAVGGYVLALAIILGGLSAGLGRGFDRRLVGLHVGWSLLCATPSYLVGYVIAAAVT